MEVYKNIEGYEGLYQVSNLGNVKSLGNNKNRSEKFMKPTKTDKGYIRIYLTKGNKQKIFFLSRLVASAFIPNPENKPQVNHINGIKTDNTVKNLEWCTVSENIKHAFDNGLKVPVVGENHCRAKLTESEVLEIRNSDLNQYKLAEIYGIGQDHISRIKTRVLWKHI